MTSAPVTREQLDEWAALAKAAEQSTSVRGEQQHLKVEPSVLLRLIARVKELEAMREGVQGVLDDAWIRLPPDADEALKEAIGVL